MTDSFEIGLKSERMDNRLRLNASVFSTDVEGFQFFAFLAAISAQALVGIDAVSIQGIELDAIYRVTANLDIYGSFGSTDSEIDQYGVDAASNGNKAPYIPENTINIGAQYRLAVSDNLSLFSRVDYERRGEQFWDPQNSTVRSALNLVNLRFALEDNSNKWSLAATLHNATDEVYNSEYVTGGFAHLAPPRVWNVDFRYNF